MPRSPAKIAGRKFGGGMLIARESRRDPTLHHGKLFWVLDCRCGGTTTARAADLLAGKVTSCGCRHKKMVAKLGRRTLKRHWKKLRSKQVIREGGQTWYCRAKAMRYVGASGSAINTWKIFCPILDRGIETRVFTRIFDEDYYLKSDLDAIRRAKAHLIGRREIPGFVHWDKAMEMLGVSEMTLRRRLARAKVKTTRFTSKHKEGWTLSLAYVPERFFESKKAGTRRAEPATDDKDIYQELMEKQLNAQRATLQATVKSGELICETFKATRPPPSPSILDRLRGSIKTHGKDKKPTTIIKGIVGKMEGLKALRTLEANGEYDGFTRKAR